MIASIGIDPGLKGCIAVVTSAGGVENVMVWDLPTTSVVVVRKAYNRLDPVALLDLCHDLHDRFPGVLAMLEHPLVQAKNGALTAYSMGHGIGTLTTALTAAGIPWKPVDPSSWKRRMAIPGGAEGKDVARQMAQRRWPDDAQMFARKKDDGRAEACLLAAMRLDEITKGVAA